MSEASIPHAPPFRLVSPSAPQSVRCPCCTMVIPIVMNGKPKNLLPKHMCEHHHAQHGHPLYDHTFIAHNVMKHLVTLCDKFNVAQRIAQLAYSATLPYAVVQLLPLRPPH